MVSTKHRMRNRHGLEIVILVERPQNPAGLLVVMHGMFGCKEQPAMQALSTTGLAHNLCVVRFDATHSIGESGGDPAQSTITAAVDDLADLLDWSCLQSWYQSPFILAGYSMGSMAALEYAHRYPEAIKGLALLGCVASGALTYEAAVAADGRAIDDWRETGVRVMQIKERGDMTVHVPWNHMQDRFHYDALPYAADLKMPVFMFAGLEDIICTPAHQRRLFDALGTDKKDLFLLPDIGHAYETMLDIQVLTAHFDYWLKKLL